MAVAAFDTGASATGAPTAPTPAAVSWTHVVGASANFLLVGTSIQELGISSEGLYIDSITFDGVNLSFLGEQANIAVADLWYLANPTTGSHTVTVNFGGNGSGTFEGASASVTNINTSDPFVDGGVWAGTGTDDGSPGSDPFVDVGGVGHSTVNNLIVTMLAVAYGFITISPGAGQTQVATPTSFGASSYRQSAIGGRTMSWTMTPLASGEWAMLGIELRAITANNLPILGVG